MPPPDPAHIRSTLLVSIAATAAIGGVGVVWGMEAAPALPVRVPVIEAIEAVAAQYELDEPAIRLSKLGPRLYVDVDVAVGADTTIDLQHQVRVDLEQRLALIPHDVWLTLEMLPRPARDNEVI